MNLEIRTRCVHIVFIEKELKVFLVQSGANDYTFPAAVAHNSGENTGSTNELHSPLVDPHCQFAGQIDRTPILMCDAADPYLAFDLYILIKPNISSISYEEGKWFSFQEATVLSTDISAVISKTLKKLREELNYQPIEYHLLPENFTITELQNFYELILNKKLNRGNFYRKMINLEVLESKGLQIVGNTLRPTIIYSFNKNYFKKTEEGLFKEF